MPSGDPPNFVSQDGILVVQQCDELVDVLVELHRTNPEAVGTLIHYMLLSVDQESLNEGCLRTGGYGGAADFSRNIV